MRNDLTAYVYKDCDTEIEVSCVNGLAFISIDDRFEAHVVTADMQAIGDLYRYLGCLLGERKDAEPWEIPPDTKCKCCAMGDVNTDAYWVGSSAECECECHGRENLG